MSTWDADSYQPFLDQGVAPPRTAVSGQGGEHRIDPKLIAEAISEAQPLVRPTKPRTSVRASEGIEEEYEEEETLGDADFVNDAADLNLRSEGRRASGSPTPSPAMRPDDGGDAGGVVRGFAGAPPARELAASGEEDKREDSKDGATAPPQRLAQRASAPRLGKVLYFDEDGAMASLLPRGLRLTVFIDGMRARTVVDYMFENPRDQVLQGTFYYSLPPGASAAGFGMFRGSPELAKLSSIKGAASLTSGLQGMPRSFESLRDGLVGGAEGGIDWQDLQEARVVGQVQARKVYEAIVRKSIDPALLEWSGGNTFRGRVFPLQPKALKRVALAYEEDLVREGGELVWRYPIPEDSALGEIPVEVFVHDAPGPASFDRRSRGAAPRRDARAVRRAGPATTSSPRAG